MIGIKKAIWLIRAALWKTNLLTIRWNHGEARQTCPVPSEQKLDQKRLQAWRLPSPTLAHTPCQELPSLPDSQKQCSLLFFFLGREAMYSQKQASHDPLEVRLSEGLNSSKKRTHCFKNNWKKENSIVVQTLFYLYKSIQFVFLMPFPHSPLPMKYIWLKFNLLLRN